jgi:hypothetical protein
MTIIGFFLGVKRASVKLTTQLHLMPRIKAVELKGKSPIIAHVCISASRCSTLLPLHVSQLLGSCYQSEIGLLRFDALFAAKRGKILVKTEKFLDN